MPTEGRAPFFNFQGSFSRFIQRTDWWSPLIIFVLSAWSVASIYSMQSLNEPNLWKQDYAVKQIVFVGIGWGVYWAAATVNIKTYERYAHWIYAAGIALLIPIAVCALLKTDIGSFITARNGARRWYNFPSFGIQPSEIAKITTLIFLSLTAGSGVVSGEIAWPRRTFKNVKKRILPIIFFFAGWIFDFFRAEKRLPGATSPTELSILENALVRIANGIFPKRLAGALPKYLPLIVRTGALTLLPFALIFVQPDLASSLVFLPMYFSLLFIANVPLRFFAFVGILALPVAVLLAVDMSRYGAALAEHSDAKDPADAIAATFQDGVLPLKNYQRARLMGLFDPELLDPKGIGKTLQATQAKIAAAQGGFSGQGFRQGMQARLGYLSDFAAHNDFIFSCIAEESGFIGGCSVIGLFAALVGIMLRVAAKARDKFGACVATGAAVIMAMHAVMNIGMNIGLLPVTGKALPFLSYGGSSVISCFLLSGLVQSVYRSRRHVSDGEKTPRIGFVAGTHPMMRSSV